jgi:hypothetical protein
LDLERVAEQVAGVLFVGVLDGVGAGGFENEKVAQVEEGEIRVGLAGLEGDGIVFFDRAAEATASCLTVGGEGGGLAIGGDDINAIGGPESVVPDLLRLIGGVADGIVNENGVGGSEGGLIDPDAGLEAIVDWTPMVRCGGRLRGLICGHSARDYEKQGSRQCRRCQTDKKKMDWIFHYRHWKKFAVGRGDTF